MSKKTRFSRIMSVLLLLTLVLASMPTTAFASNNDSKYYTTFRNLDHAWQNSTDMVDVSFRDWEKEWVEWMCSTDRHSTFSEIVEGAYNATVEYAEFNYDAYSKKVNYDGRTKRVENLPKKEMYKYLPQYTFSECLNQVIKYVDNDYRSRYQPEWTEADYARFMVGLLRAQNVPAYIIVGTQGDRYTYRVAMVDSHNNRVYYSDPARGVTTGNTSKWRWLSNSEYDDDFKYSHVYNENVTSGNDLPEDRDYTSTAVSIPENKRFGGTDIKIPVKKDGNTQNIYMRVVFYDGDAYFWVRDVAKMLEHTTGEFWVEYDGTLLFGLGDYVANGTEVNWGRDRKSIPIDKLSQAYVLSHAYCDGTRIRMNVIQIGSDLYVRPDDITSALGVRGLNINVKITE